MLSRERRLLLIVAAHGGRILASVFILDAKGATRPVARDDGDAPGLEAQSARRSICRPAFPNGRRTGSASRKAACFGSRLRRAKRSVRRAPCSAPEPELLRRSPP